MLKRKISRIAILLSSTMLATPTFAQVDEIIVSAGLASGDRVVTSPLRGADVGSKVAPVDPKKADRPAADDDPTPQSATAEALKGEAGL